MPNTKVFLFVGASFAFILVFGALCALWVGHDDRGRKLENELEEWERRGK